MGTETGPPGIERKHWPSFLRGENAEEVLAKLRDSDPLRLREGTARRLREAWVLLDPDRVFYRALSVVADRAPREQPPADLEVWARTKIEVAIEQLVRSDREAERLRPETLTEEERDFPLLTKSAMIEPELVRKVSVAFNALPPLPRRAFFELVIEGKEVDECIESGPWDEDGLYEAIQTSLATLNLDAGPEDPGRSKENP